MSAKARTATHPVLPWTITLDPQWHSFRDQENRRYKSVSAILRKFFPPFDRDGTAAKVSARTGQPVAEIIAQWEAKREAAADFGDRVHAYVEAVAAGMAPEPVQSPNEATARSCVDAALSMLARSYDLLPPEQIVFDPMHMIAGVIDVPAANRATGAFAIIDWKTNEKIEDNAWGRTGLPPIEDVPDSGAAHYALQQSLLAWIMQDSGYLPPEQPIELALVHIPPGASAPRWIPVTYYRTQVERIIEHQWGTEILPAACARNRHVEPQEQEPCCGASESSVPF